MKELTLDSELFTHVFELLVSLVEPPPDPALMSDGRLSRRRTSGAIGEPANVPPLPNPPAWHGLVAGSVAGASGVLVGHAFDTAKVQAQVGGSSSMKLSPSAVLGLYRGVLPPLMSTGAVRSLYFGVYEVTRPSISRALTLPEDNTRAVFIAGSVTGLLTAPVTAPMQRLKLVQQIQGGSLRDCFRRLAPNAGLFRGLGLHCALETIGSGCYLTAYVVCKAQLRKLGVGATTPEEGSRKVADGTSGSGGVATSARDGMISVVAVQTGGSRSSSGGRSVDSRATEAAACSGSDSKGGGTEAAAGAGGRGRGNGGGAAAVSVLATPSAASSPSSPLAEPLALRVLSGMFAGVVGWVSIYPLDVLRSRVMSVVPPMMTTAAAAGPASGGGGAPPPEALAPLSPEAGAARAATFSLQPALRAPTHAPAPPSQLYGMIAQAARETYANGGLRGFFRGITFTLMRAAPVAGVVLPVYDTCKARLANSMQSSGA